MVRLLTAERYNDLHKDHSCRSKLVADLGSSIPFCSESSLIEEFLTVIRLPEAQSVFVYSELDAGNGIADVAIMAKRRNNEKYRFLSQLKPQWVYPIVALPYRKLFDTELFANLACLSSVTAARILRKCCDLGVCEKRSHGWIKTIQPRAPYNKIYAIEAKLRDWRRALFQASRYQEFSHQSWVLLDSHYAAPAISHIDEFKRRNLGLLVLGKSGHLMSICEPSIAEPKSMYRYWYAMAEAFQLSAI